MRKLLGMIVLFSALNTQAEESIATMPTVETNQMRSEMASELESSPAKTPSFRFQMGKSNVDFGTSYYETKGEGLTVGASFDLTSFIAIGGSYTNLKIEQTDVSYNGFPWQNKYSSDVFTGNIEATPIRYNLGNMDFSGSILFGMMNNAIHGEKDTVLFYGGAISMSLSRQIGISLDTKVSKDLNSMNQISLVGYY